VKTRLTPRFSPEEALALHRALLIDSLALMFQCAESAGAACHLYLSEEGPLDGEMTARLGSMTPRIQSGVDLGDRLLHAIQECLAEGVREIVVLGSDSPHLPAVYVARAFEKLGKAEVVVGPARDGGYYLLGASRLHPALLTDMPWGTAQLYRETVRRARKDGIPIASLPAWYDVDLPESVVQLWQELSLRHARGEADLPRACFTLLQTWSRDGKLA
jgi:rSAM/selenodomain-associated transferase 1